MGIGEWWRKLWTKPEIEAPPGEDLGPEPGQVAALADTIALSERLVVREFRHAVTTPSGVLRLRTFLTEGLRAFDAPEVSVSLRVGEDPRAEACAFSLFRGLEGFAAGGEPAELGGFTGFSADYGGGRPIGVTYARGTRIGGIPGGVDTLAAVLLHQDELALVQEGYATRVLARLAERARYFPYPAWWELRDVPVFSVAEQRRSFIDRVAPRAHPHDARVTFIDERELVVSLPADARETFDEVLCDAPEEAGVLILADLAPDADGQMVWFHGSTDRHATSSGDGPPRRMGQSFVMFTAVPGLVRVGFVEDGAVVSLTRERFASLREALVAGERARFAMDDGLSVRVEFRRDAPWAHGVERYEPTAGSRADAGRVALSRITLLVKEEDLDARVETRPLAQYIERLRAEMERVAAEHPVDARSLVAVKVALRADGDVDVTPASEGEGAREFLAALPDALRSVERVEVRGDVGFRLETEVHPHPLGG